MHQIHLQNALLLRIHRVRAHRCPARFHQANLLILMEEALQDLTMVMTINFIEYVQNLIIREEIVPDHNPIDPIRRVCFQLYYNSFDFLFFY